MDKPQHGSNTMHLLLTSICPLVLGLYLLPVWRSQGWRGLATLSPAILATAWLIFLENHLVDSPENLTSSLSLLLFSQYLLGPAWLLFSLSYGRDLRWNLVSNLDKLLTLFALLPLLFIVPLPASSFFFVADFRAEPLLFLEPGAFFFYLHLALVLLLSAGNLESTLRGSQHSDRWRLKLAFLGAGVIIISLTLFYSQCLLVRALNMQYLPLRSLGILAGALLLCFAEWRRQSGRVRVARRTVFRSLAVATAGLYLLGIGLARESARHFGPSFEQYVLAFLLLVLCLAGFLLLLSQRLRRRVSIWAHRNLYNEKYDYRGQWIQFSERLSQATDKDSLFRAVLLGYCETFGFMGAVFVPVDNERPDRMGTPVYYELDENAGDKPEPKDFASLLSCPGVPVSPKTLKASLPDRLAAHLRALDAGLVGTISAAGDPEGVIILGPCIDGKEKHDQEDFELMEAMGRQIGLCARGFRLGDELSTAREMEALSRLGAFVLHDLKNQVYALSLLTENARKFITKPDFQQDLLETLGNTVANMKILITQLTCLPKKSALRLESVELLALARDACGRVPGANVGFSGAPLTVQGDVEQLAKVITNLCLNSVEAGGAKPIRVEVAMEDAPLLRIEDQGGGIPETVLRNGPFKPFNTGKQRGMGIGLYHSQKIMESHGGTITVENKAGKGCTFTMRFASRTAGGQTRGTAEII